MAQIISLEQRAQGRRHAAPIDGGGQILFFLGVRYTRMEEPPLHMLPSEPSEGGGKKKKRRARA
ncbi:MAG TPA: hypothetical protein VEH76_07790 [Methylocystis sp.]|nr:hypothetical protein [Methylocystis sp.]